MSQICYLFNDKPTADAACAKCNAGLNDTWARVRERVSDGKFFFEKPDELDFNCENCSEEVKCEYTEEENDGSWGAITEE